MRATGPGQPAHLLVAVVGLINELGVPCAVVGAFAVSFHGLPRFTNDADASVWLKGTGKTAENLHDALAKAGYRVALKLGDVDDPIAGVLTIQDEHGNRVDLILGIRGMDPGAVERSVPTSLLNASLRIIGVEDLIAMKLFAGGPRDLEDVRGILQVSSAHLNLELLRNLTNRYGRDAATRLDALLTEQS